MPVILPTQYVTEQIQSLYLTAMPSNSSGDDSNSEEGIELKDLTGKKLFK